MDAAHEFNSVPTPPVKRRAEVPGAPMRAAKMTRMSGLAAAARSQDALNNTTPPRSMLECLRGGSAPSPLPPGYIAEGVRALRNFGKNSQVSRCAEEVAEANRLPPQSPPPPPAPPHVFRAPKSSTALTTTKSRWRAMNAQHMPTPPSSPDGALASLVSVGATPTPVPPLGRHYARTAITKGPVGTYAHQHSSGTNGVDTPQAAFVFGVGSAETYNAACIATPQQLRAMTAASIEQPWSTPGSLFAATAAALARADVGDDEMSMGGSPFAAPAAATYDAGGGAACARISVF